MRGKEYKNNYIIIALICLIVFNIGTIIINLIDLKGEEQIEAKEVFNPESYIENDFYLMVLGRTSSIINLYRKEQVRDRNLLSIRELIDKSLNSLFKGQFPAIINYYGKASAKGPLDENDMERYDNDPEVLEDIIIIEKVEEYEDLVIIRDSEGKVAWKIYLNP